MILKKLCNVPAQVDVVVSYLVLMFMTLLAVVFVFRSNILLLNSLHDVL